MKMKLEEHKGSRLTRSLKCYRLTKKTSRSSTGETPISLVYAVETMILWKSAYLLSGVKLITQKKITP